MTIHATAAPVSPGRAAVSRLPGHDAARWSADEALEQLYAAHWRRLVRVSVLLVRDLPTAEEVVQDAFVAVHGRWGRLRDPDRALAYLHRCVVNGSRSVLRHRAVVTRHAVREPVPLSVPGADDAVAADSRREAVLDAVRVLPQRQREVMVLRYYLDLSEAEIAATLGLSRGAVKSHASRGAAALRIALRPQLNDQLNDQLSDQSRAHWSAQREDLP